MSPSSAVAEDVADAQSESSALVLDFSTSNNVDADKWVTKLKDVASALNGQYQKIGKDIYQAGRCMSTLVDKKTDKILNPIAYRKLKDSIRVAVSAKELQPGRITRLDRKTRREHLVVIEARVDKLPLCTKLELWEKNLMDYVGEADLGNLTRMLALKEPLLTE